MSALGNFSEGSQLVLDLLPYVSEEETVFVVEFGLFEHTEMCDEEERRGLHELDTFTRDNITVETINELVERMKVLKEHRVFQCGRSFYLEGYTFDNYVASAVNPRMLIVYFSWGS